MRQYVRIAVTLVVLSLWFFFPDSKSFGRRPTQRHLPKTVMKIFSLHNKNDKWLLNIDGIFVTERIVNKYLQIFE